MKPSRLGLGLIAFAALLSSAVGSPVIFTVDTLIDPLNGMFEGQEIVVSNAVLTVDGPHSFASLRLAEGAVLTHTAGSNGVVSVLLEVTNEPALLVGTNAVTLLQSNVNWSSVVVREQAGPLIYTNGVDYFLSLVSPVNGLSTVQRTETSAIPDGATVLVSYQYSQTYHAGLNLIIIGDMQVEAGSSINAAGRGYRPGQGLGFGSSAGSPLSGAGGGYGGYGGISSSNAPAGIPFGSPFEPASAGGAGGSGLGGIGGAGGGSVRLIVESNFVLNGSVTVNGLNATNSRAGGGAGGSVWVTAQTISGSGAFSANGGAGEPIHGGGGGGGRIALELATNLFTGTITAFGGNGWQRGGAGSIFLRTLGTAGEMRFDNGGVSGAATVMALTNATDLIIQGRATALVGGPQTVRSLIVRSNSSITTISTNAAILTLIVSGDAVIEDGASFSMAGKGFPANQGPGLGQSSPFAGSGGGHGGYGGSGISGTTVVSGGNYYGSLTNPIMFGSGGRTAASQFGAGGSGGGVVRFTIGGNLRLDGSIAVDGTAGFGSSAGGASAGSVWLTLGGLSGTGIISANGGAGGLPNGGGGAGGRIAITCDSNSFAGTLVARGGDGAVAGSAGTIYSKLTSLANADLLINNGGLTGTNSVLDVGGNYNLTVSGGGALKLTSSLALGTLAVESNSVVLIGSVTTGAANLSLNVASNAIIALGGRISGDGLGAPGGTGSGAGLPGIAGSAGGGYGGYGGRGAIAPTGGNAYGTSSSPNLPGSGGGGLNQSGGAGGAALRMVVSGDLILDGRISMNGQSVGTNNAGGGSGGGLSLSLNRFFGSGSVSADGGSGHLPAGGGGAGGRIAVTWNSNSFAGSYSAKGANGFMPGGAGTILLKANNQPNPNLIVDNGGLPGTNTVLDLTQLLNLTIGPGASLASSSTVIISSNLTIAPNGLWRADQLVLTVGGTATIAAGGALSIDAYSTQGGVGNYNPFGSGGGGHGGFGGLGGGGGGTTLGGNVYDSPSNPEQPGSPGGFPFTQGAGRGLGGGTLRMTVLGPLIVDGRVSADGGNSVTNNGGGGSGGSVRLTLNQLSGSGVISANGGLGHLPSGGGGGGGRVAVYFNTNSFDGSITARGGNGFVGGGAGTVYLKANQQPLPSLIFDNGGLVGTNTLWNDLTLISLQNLTITSGASVASSLSSVTISGNLSIGSNSIWRISGLNVTAGSASIAAGGSLSADGASTTAGSGNGQYNSVGSSGAGHGGYGGRGLGAAVGGNVYGTISNPSLAGSSGGAIGFTAAGGGSLHLTVAGPLLLNGRISADGANSLTNYGGGGSGGSVWLTLNQFQGSGSVSANGGSGHLPNGGGGGGGRISITWSANSFIGNYSARGGNGFAGGGAGTICLRPNNSQAPSLIVDNGGLVGAGTVLDGTFLLNLNIGSGTIITSFVPSITVISNLTLGANATWRAAALSLSAGSVTIAPGGGFVADGASSSTMSFPQGNLLGSAGAGHGGYGGRGAGTTFGGGTYGSTSNPIQPGSRGGNSSSEFAAAGGGTVTMTVSGPVILNGRISANGNNSVTNNGGGGSGGSILLSMNQFSGSGTISANGGAGHSPNGGGGGGGRVAIFFTTNTFAGSLSARGGNGFVPGGAGTIALQPRNLRYPDVIADNGGLVGSNTVVDISNINNLTVSGGARLASPSFLSLANLNVATNSALLSLFNWSLSISGTATVAAGGRISVDGFNASGQGNGASGTPGSGGGGHGGYGGRGFNSSPVGGSSAGGNASDSLSSPTIGGGRGGSSQGSTANGGGMMTIFATGPFRLDGTISANGLSSSTNGGGGGAGGSLWLNFDELVGNGAITVDGGSGHLPYGGGGGGGRISVSYNFLKGNFPMNGFTGSYSAKGGAGYMRGGAGTVFVRTNGSSVANVFADNGGLGGTNTLVSGTGIFDLYVQGGAIATNLGTPRDLFVRSNSWVFQSGNVSVSRNATFDAGSGINLDGLGFSSAGAGSMNGTPYGGAGHGGNGALNPNGGGEAYDSAISPTMNGSYAGSVYAMLAGGGGAVHLTVGNTLRLDGEISVDGTDGIANSGGGSGGSAWIQTGTFLGSGLITATGGNGNGPNGGGGGGRIAVYFNTNSFTGLMSACGGGGGAFGGAGTVYLRDNVRMVSSLLLDNCGNWGASTPLSQFSGLATDLSVTGSALAEMRGAIPTFSNLVVSARGVVTSGDFDTNLSLALLGNLSVTEDAGIIADSKGFARDSGPGYGSSFNGQGAGGSYGGWGGDSASGAWGGSIYGSAIRPVDRGSGGGSGSGYPAAGSEGGGAIRIAVAGTAEVNGLISASGGLGWQDDAGGGSGGSIWLSARRFTGYGTLAAIGGDADFFGGGGGGGGRIAIYSPTNTFTGLVSVIGGDGANFGLAGTIFTSGSLGGIDVVAQTPTGIVSNIVSQVALEFTEPVNLASVSASDVRIYTPYGLLPGTNQTYSSPSPTTLLVSFNPQNVPGNYRLELGPLIEGLLAPRMSQVHTGMFSIALPMISGTVTNLDGQPVAGITILPSGGLIGANTDVNGNYSIGVPLGWFGAMTPVHGTNAFVPGRLSYTNINSSVGGQNYLMVATIAPALNSSLTASGLSLSWNGIPGVLYQAESSTNLVNWLPYGPSLPGTNGLMQLLVPTDGDPLKFVRLRAAN